MTSNAQDPNEEIMEESSTPSTPVTSPPTAAVETSSSTGSIQTDNPQSETKNLSSPLKKIFRKEPTYALLGSSSNDKYSESVRLIDVCKNCAMFVND